MKTSNSEALPDQIPAFYRAFLKTSTNPIINGLPLYGLEGSDSEFDLISANQVFSLTHPQLSDEYLVIRFFEDSALLIQKTENSKKDGALFRLNIDARENGVSKLDISFSQYIREARDWDKQREQVFEIVEKLIFQNSQNSKRYTRSSSNTKIPFKARDWKIVRSAVHDLIVALVGFRYNEKSNSLEVCAFLVTDHPHYEPGHGITAALNMLFSAAYKNGSSFELRFVKDFDGRKKVTIPASIVRYAEENNLKLDGTKSIISHETGLEIYLHVSGVSAGLERVWKNNKKKYAISLQGLCFLANLRIWESHEIKFVLENSSNAEGLLFGKDLPENWSAFEYSLHFGRNVIAVTKLCKSIDDLLQDDCANTDVEAVEDCFRIKTSCLVEIDSAITDADVPRTIDAGEVYEVFPRIRRFYQFSDIEDDLDYVNRRNKNAQTILLYSSEVGQDPQAIEFLKGKSENLIVVLPAIADELDDEVIKRMKRTKSLRK